MGAKTADMQLICYKTYACREVEPFDALIYPYSQYLQGKLFAWASFFKNPVTTQRKILLHFEKPADSLLFT